MSNDKDDTAVVPADTSLASNQVAAKDEAEVEPALTAEKRQLKMSIEAEKEKERNDPLKWRPPPSYRSFSLAVDASDLKEEAKLDPSVERMLERQRFWREKSDRERREFQAFVFKEIARIDANLNVIGNLHSKTNAKIAAGKRLHRQQHFIKHYILEQQKREEERQQQAEQIAKQQSLVANKTPIRHSKAAIKVKKTAEEAVRKKPPALPPQDFSSSANRQQAGDGQLSRMSSTSTAVDPQQWQVVQSSLSPSQAKSKELLSYFKTKVKQSESKTAAGSQTARPCLTLETEDLPDSLYGEPTSRPSTSQRPASSRSVLSPQPPHIPRTNTPGQSLKSKMLAAASLTNMNKNFQQQLQTPQPPKQAKPKKVLPKGSNTKRNGKGVIRDTAFTRQFKKAGAKTVDWIEILRVQEKLKHEAGKRLTSRPFHHVATNLETHNLSISGGSAPNLDTLVAAALPASLAASASASAETGDLLVDFQAFLDEAKPQLTAAQNSSPNLPQITFQPTASAAQPAKAAAEPHTGSLVHIAEGVAVNRDIVQSPALPTPPQTSGKLEHQIVAELPSSKLASFADVVQTVTGKRQAKSRVSSSLSRTSHANSADQVVAYVNEDGQLIKAPHQFDLFHWHSEFKEHEHPNLITEYGCGKAASKQAKRTNLVAEWGKWLSVRKKFVRRETSDAEKEHCHQLFNYLHPLPNGTIRVSEIVKGMAMMGMKEKPEELLKAFHVNADDSGCISFEDFFYHLWHGDAWESMFKAQEVDDEQKRKAALHARNMANQAKLVADIKDHHSHYSHVARRKSFNISAPTVHHKKRKETAGAKNKEGHTEGAKAGPNKKVGSAAQGQEPNQPDASYGRYGRHNKSNMPAREAERDKTLRTTGRDEGRKDADDPSNPQQGKKKKKKKKEKRSASQLEQDRREQEMDLLLNRGYWIPSPSLSPTNMDREKENKPEIVGLGPAGTWVKHTSTNLPLFLWIPAYKRTENLEELMQETEQVYVPRTRTVNPKHEFFRKHGQEKDKRDGNHYWGQMNVLKMEQHLQAHHGKNELVKEEVLFDVFSSNVDYLDHPEHMIAAANGDQNSNDLLLALDGKLGGKSEKMDQEAQSKKKKTNKKTSKKKTAKQSKISHKPLSTQSPRETEAAASAETSPRQQGGRNTERSISPSMKHFSDVAVRVHKFVANGRQEKAQKAAEAEPQQEEEEEEHGGTKQNSSLVQSRGTTNWKYLQQNLADKTTKEGITDTIEGGLEDEVDIVWARLRTEKRPSVDFDLTRHQRNVRLEKRIIKELETNSLSQIFQNLRWQVQRDEALFGPPKETIENTKFGWETPSRTTTPDVALPNFGLADPKTAAGEMAAHDSYRNRGWDRWNKDKNIEALLAKHTGEAPKQTAVQLQIQEMQNRTRSRMRSRQNGRSSRQSNSSQTRG